jgi:hypothetical protein
MECQVPRDNQATVSGRLGVMAFTPRRLVDGRGVVNAGGMLRLLTDLVDGSRSRADV